MNKISFPSLETIGQQIINLNKHPDLLNQLITFAQYSKSFTDFEPIEKLLPSKQAKITGCELPIIIHFNENFFHCYSKSKVIRSYLILISYLYTLDIEWMPWFTEHKIDSFLTTSRIQGLTQYWQFLHQFERSWLQQNFLLA